MYHENKRSFDLGYIDPNKTFHQITEMGRTNVAYVLIRKRQRYKMEALAMALPILPGKTEDRKQLCQEMLGPRPSE